MKEGVNEKKGVLLLGDALCQASCIMLLTLSLGRADNGPQGTGQEKCPTEESQEGVEGKRVSLSSSFSQDF